MDSGAEEIITVVNDLFPGVLPGSGSGKLLQPQTVDDFVALTSGSQPAVVWFTAAWCQPCKMITPHMLAMCNQFGESVNFIKVDIDSCKDIAEHFKIKSVPTFHVRAVPCRAVSVHVDAW